MPEYKIYAPIAVTADNFEAFKALLALGQNVMPTRIAEFAAANGTNAFTEIKGPSLLVIPGEQKGTYTQVRLFTSDKASPPAPSKMAALFLDVTDLGGGKFSSQPRQWLLGADVQALIPYKMSCCSGLSAIAAYKQGGKLQPALLENAKFVQLGRNDIFGLSKEGESGLKVDETGGMLKHWYTHLMRIQHNCASQARIAVPPRLLAFRA